MELAPHFKINVVENALEDCIFQLIKHVRPKWDTARIKTKSQKYSPNTLWPKLSMLRSMLHLKEKTDVKLFDEVEAFVKNKNKGYVPKKSAVLSREQLKTFLSEAPNDVFLMYKLMTDGITNKLVLCRNITDDGIEEHLLVRVYGHKTDLLIDRKAEIRNIQLLHQYGLAPSLYATFENGLVYEFIPGRTLSYEDVSNPKIYKMVAKEMAKMHKVKHPVDQKPVANFWSKLQQFVDLVPDKFDDEIKQKAYEKQNFSKEQLLKEIREFREGVRDFDMDIVFAHNDLLLGNIIYNEDKNKVFFIDYEYASYNYQPFDIANHFTEFAGVSEIDYSRFPQKDLQMDWLKTYLLEYKGVTAVSDRDVETLYIQVNKFVLAAHLFWYSWSLIQAAHSHIDFDFIGYAANRIEDYFKRKPEISAL